MVYAVVAHYRAPDLGEFVILKHHFPGGWQTTPVTFAVWVSEGYGRLPSELHE